jgi:hypothetical protein
VAGRLAKGLGTGKTAALGLGGVAAGLLLMMGASREGGLLAVRAGTVVGEAGFTFSNVSPPIAGTGATGGDGRGLAAGLLNTSFQLGNAWGLGVVHPGRRDGGPGPLVGGLGAGILACTGFALLAMPIAFFGLPGDKFLQAPTMEGSKSSAGGGTAAAVPRGYRAAASFRPEGPTPPSCRTRRPPASRR